MLDLVNEDVKATANDVLTQIANKNSSFSLERQRNSIEEEVYHFKKYLCCTRCKNIILCLILVMLSIILTEYKTLTFSFEEYNCFYDQRQTDRETAKLFQPFYTCYAGSHQSNAHVIEVCKIHDRARTIRYANVHKLAMSDTLLFDAGLLPSCVQGKDTPKK